MATKDETMIQVLSRMHRTISSMHTHLTMTDDFLRHRFVNPPTYPMHHIEQEVRTLDGQIASLQFMMMDNEYHVGLLHKDD